MLGSVITSAVALVASYLIIPGVRHRFILDRQSAREILGFGKWIFLSSVIYFLAMNFDRLYFAKQITLDHARHLFDRAIDGRHAEQFRDPDQQHGALPSGRGNAGVRAGSPFAAVALTAHDAAAGRDRAWPVSWRSRTSVILRLYDDRYEQAAIMLPLMLLGVWVAVLCTVNDSVLLGTAKPAYPAIANAAKLATFIIGVPIAFHYYGLLGALIVLNVGEVVRYVVLWAVQPPPAPRFRSGRSGADDPVHHRRPRRSRAFLRWSD